jgi:hypothetical protein
MASFTEEAEQAFTEANAACDRALASNNEMHKLDNMNAAIQDIAFGLLNLSRGLRATYIKIEQLDSTIRQLEHRGGGLLGR